MGKVDMFLLILISSGIGSLHTFPMFYLLLKTLGNRQLASKHFFISSHVIVRFPKPTPFMSSACLISLCAASRPPVDAKYAMATSHSRSGLEDGPLSHNDDCTSAF